MSNITNTTKNGFPTAFKVFMAQHTLAEKRFMRKVCDVVEASTGLKAHSKWNPVAGTQLQDGNATPVPGFNVMVECGSKEDRGRVRRLFWTPEAMLADGRYDVVTIASHSRSVEVPDIEVSPVLVVADLLGVENVVVPSAWAEKNEQLQARNDEKAQKKAAREAKKLEVAAKRADHAAGVLARRMERKAKKLLKVTAEAQAIELPVPSETVVTEGMTI